MATFTLRLEQAFKAHGGVATLDQGRWHLDKPELIGLGYYPIYEESYRDVLNGLIFDHYQNQEIGLETVTMFAGAVRSKMNQIMPFYNEMYVSKLIEFDPLVTTNLRNTVSSLMEQTGATATTEDSTSTTSSETENSAKSRAVASTTPQGMLKGTGDYASSAQDNVSGSDGTATGEAVANTEQSGTNEATASSDSDSHSIGYQGIPGDLINAARNAIINVDMMIVSELEEFFMSVWNTTDQYTPQNNFLGAFNNGY